MYETQAAVNYPTLLAFVRSLMLGRAADRVYLDLFFETDMWNGTVENREPDKCAKLR